MYVCLSIAWQSLCCVSLSGLKVPEIQIWVTDKFYLCRYSVFSHSKTTHRKIQLIIINVFFLTLCFAFVHTELMSWVKPIMEVQIWGKKGILASNAKFLPWCLQSSDYLGQISFHSGKYIGWTGWCPRLQLLKQWMSYLWTSMTRKK